jgi:hypothetical protein
VERASGEALVLEGGPRQKSSPIWGASASSNSRTDRTFPARLGMPLFYIHGPLRDPERYRRCTQRTRPRCPLLRACISPPELLDRLLQQELPTPV